jgi:serine phosphatase RsbU (regulator of sigma subunit)
MNHTTQADTIGSLVPSGQARDDQRRAIFLNRLNKSVFFATVIGLGISLFPPLPPFFFILIILVSLGVNGIIYSLIKANHIRFGSRLFVSWINLGIIALFLGNLLPNEPDLTSARLYSALLSLSVMLAGILIKPASSFIFAVSDILVIVIGHTIYMSLQPAIIGSPVDEVLRASFPVAVFLLLSAAISYLSQQALLQSQEKLDIANAQILKDELLRREMDLARKVQEGIYPPPFANQHISIAALSQPAYETSGDFYDYLELGPNRLGLIIADVTGKGLAAALGMAMIRSAVRSEAMRGASPAEVLYQANINLRADHALRLMATCFYGVLDLNTMELRFSNAGHPYPLLKRAGQLAEYDLPGAPLGSEDAPHYDEIAIPLEVGDQLVLVSDGAFEERNEAGDLFGFERMNAIIAQMKGDNPYATVEAIRDAVDLFRGTRLQSDDLTLLAIQIEAQVAVAQPTPTLAPAKELQAALGEQ